MTDFNKGDKVRIDPEYARSEAHRTSVYTVVKVNQKTYGLTNDDTGAKLNADKRVVIAADAPAPVHATPEYDLTTIAIGTVVKIDARQVRGADPKALYVVTGHGGGRYFIGHRASKLGGADGARYFGGLPPKTLTPVSLEDAAAHIIEAL